MTWTAYQVSFRLLAPLHVGWRKLGNLQQTRSYVTGRSLWGALTARLTRELGRRDYSDIGKGVDKQLAFTYFYPSIQLDGSLLWPWPDQWDKFAWTFLGSYASTALENARNAESGSLHETEFIAPYTREGEPTYLVGYIFENDNLKLDRQSPLVDWQSVLGKLQFGGERSYGWGRVELEGCKVVTDGKCFDYDLQLNGDRPLLKAPRDMHLLAHTNADADSTCSRGVAIEPLIGRETRESTGFGRSYSDVEICWIPGGNVFQGEIFRIEARGVWNAN